MKRQCIWVGASCLLALSMILVACSAKTTTTPTTSATISTTTTTTTTTTPVTTSETTSSTTTTTIPVTASNTPKYGGTISVAIDRSPVHFDPYYYDTISNDLQGNWMEDLGQADWTTDRNKFNFKANSIPAEYQTGLLAASWDIPDPLTYVFHIRQGIRWQNLPPVNGRELVADDIAYTWDRVLGTGHGFTKPDANVTLANFVNIVSVTATDKYTVTFKLSKATPLFLYNILGGASPVRPIVPKEVVDKYGNLEDWKVAVGTGPFMVQDYVRDSSLTLTKNPNYWQTDPSHPGNQLPYIDKLSFLIIPDVGTQVAALRAGKLDWTWRLKWRDADSLKKTTPTLLSEVYPRTAKALFLRVDLKPFTDIRVREALQMALDTKVIGASYYGPNCEQVQFPTFVNSNVTTVYTPCNQYPQDVQDHFTYNVEGAKKLLADAGYPTGFSTNVVMYNTEEVDLAQVVASYFSKINVQLELKVYDNATRSSILYARQQTGMNWQQVSDPNPNPLSSMLMYYPTTTWDFGNVNDPYFTTQYDNIRNEPDAAKRTAMLKDLNVYVTSQFWQIGITGGEYLYIFWEPWLKGYSGECQTQGPNNTAWVWEHVWIDKSK